MIERKREEALSLGPGGCPDVGYQVGKARAGIGVAHLWAVSEVSPGTSPPWVRLTLIFAESGISRQYQSNTEKEPAFLAVLHGMWDLISWIRDQTQAPCSGIMKS